MKILLYLALIQRLLTRVFIYRKLQIEEIDMTDPAKFEKLASLTMNLSKDIYSDSVDHASYDDNFTVFTNNSLYTDIGTVVLNISANASEYMPKMIVWDWNGDEATQIPKARFIAIRGTQSYEEWVGNFDCEETPNEELGITVAGYFHNNLGQIGQSIFNRYKSYIIDSPYPVVVTGHSRGGGLAEVLHVVSKKALLETPLSPPIYCMAHAPPPSMYLNDTDSNLLTKDIYGFVNGADVIPRLFASTLMTSFSKIKEISDAAYSCCTTFYSKKLCMLASTQQLSLYAKIISSVFPVVQRSNIVKALFERKNALLKIMENFQFNPSNVNIRRHVGNLYHLNWKSTYKKNEVVYGCLTRPLVESRLETPEELSKIDLGFKFWKAFDLINDHDASLYHHAFHDPMCPN